jgi:hypothetical protein
VCLFLPVRHNQDANHKPLDQSRYFVSDAYVAQGVCVIEFRAREMIQYEWFRDQKDRDPHILMDLTPYFAGAKRVLPGVTKPLFRFDIDGKGGWTLRVERDGRDGLAGGENGGDWDLVFTEKSEGARPYTVDVTVTNSSWAMSVFNPGGAPADTAEVLIGLKPYDRATLRSADWPSRGPRVRDVKVEDAGRGIFRAPRSPSTRRSSRPAGGG